MTRFILNNELISTDVAAGTTLLDFVRYHRNLSGTKIGCREGDCGACTILVGDVAGDQVKYMSLTSCITPLGNVNGKHVVSVEGLNMDELSPVQRAMVDEAGTQCGFCTVGFVVSLTGSCLSDKTPTFDDIINDIDGNICRCTGYKSIERAASRISDLLKLKDTNQPISWLVSNKFIPEYFSTIAQRLKHIAATPLDKGVLVVGGGTDLYVQKHHETEESFIHFINSRTDMRQIVVHDNICFIGGSCTASDIMHSKELNDAFPNLYKHMKLVSSTPIRNIGTVAGNFVNASPIGDLTAFFLALDCTVTLEDASSNQRKLALKDFFKGYKQLNKTADEVITQIEFTLPDHQTHFNFEKVSKRTYLDIASVNSACSVRVEDDVIIGMHASAGGVGPTPIYLKRTCEFLIGKKLNVKNIEAAQEIIWEEISPISDVRGTAEYKRTLLNRLFFAHFLELFPEIFMKEEAI